MRTATTLPYDNQPVGRLWDGAHGNYDTAGRKTPTMIILHSMDGTTDGSTAWFKHVDQSANYGVSLSGKLTLWIPEDCVAYQAGKYSVNQISLGIEHEDNGDNTLGRTDALYETSAKLVADIAREYSIPLDRDHVKKHNEIVPTSCPGTLDVDRIVKRAQEINGVTPAPTAPVGDSDGRPPVELTALLFERLVTKATNWDDTASFFALTEDQKRQAGAGKVVVEKLQEMQRQINSMPTAPTAPPSGMNVGTATAQQPAPTTGSTTPTVPDSANGGETPSNQDKHILFQDLSVVLSKLSRLFRKAK